MRYWIKLTSTSYGSVTKLWKTQAQLNTYKKQYFLTYNCPKSQTEDATKTAPACGVDGGGCVWRHLT